MISYLRKENVFHCKFIFVFIQFIWNLKKYKGKCLKFVYFFCVFLVENCAGSLTCWRKLLQFAGLDTFFILEG